MPRTRQPSAVSRTRRSGVSPASRVPSAPGTGGGPPPGVDLGEQGGDQLGAVVGGAVGVGRELAGQFGDRAGRPVQRTGGQRVTRTGQGTSEHRACMGHPLPQQLVGERRRRVQFGAGRGPGSGAPADLDGGGPVLGPRFVGEPERPDRQRHHLVPHRGGRVRQRVGDLAGHREPHRTGGQLDPGLRTLGRGAVHQGAVTTLEGATGRGDCAGAESIGQRTVVGGAGGPVRDGDGDRGAVRAGPGITLIGEDECDEVAAHAGCGAAATAGVQTDTGRKDRGDAVVEASTDRGVGLGREAGRGARVQLLRGSFDQAAVGERGERVGGEGQQVGAGHGPGGRLGHRPSLSATNSASRPGVIAPMCAPASASRPASSRS